MFLRLRVNSFNQRKGISSLPQSIKNRNLMTKKNLKANEVRKHFLNYFEQNGHKILPSDKLIPSRNPSLLFTNAGMVQFKDYFLGLQPVPSGHEKLTTVQKCVRIGGKHNDLDNVGKTARHLTLFEMLGNFSFGAYGKEVAIDLAWNFLTKYLNIPSQSLRVSVHETDQESLNIWHKKHEIPLDRIIKGREDNFWSMGEEPGPCGPCTEIFYNQEQPDSDGDIWLEIWNLVFMEFHKSSSGELTKLKTLCVDTGMGLERLCSVLQGKKNNFEIDSFEIIVNSVHQLAQTIRNSNGISQKDYTISLRVIADHIRSTSFLIGDGVIPSNIGRGYILRRIIRRAIRFGYQLGFKEPFLTKIYPSLIESMGEVYPELIERKERICSIISREEHVFFSTIGHGMKVLKEVIADTKKKGESDIPTNIVFQLYESYGFPQDLTQNIAHEYNLKIDINQVEKLFQEHQVRSRVWKSQDGLPPSLQNCINGWKLRNVKTTFIGYDTEIQEAIVVGFHQPENEVDPFWIAIHPCPFYGESGGQVGDQGILQLRDGTRLNVVNSLIPYEGCIALQLSSSDHNLIEGLCQLGALSTGTKLLAIVNSNLRLGAKRNHTATHLLQAALQQTLDKTIQQASSLVAPDRLRFDFTFDKSLTDEQIDQIEKWVNRSIQSCVTVQVTEMNLEEALKLGALALFSEKYSNVVRVILIHGFSKELCGGTHVSNTCEIEQFKIISEKSAGSGIRRIEAVTGTFVRDWYESQFGILRKTANLLNVKPFQVLESVEKLLQHNHQLKRELGQWRSKSLETETEKPQCEGVFQQNPVAIYLLQVDLVEKSDLKSLRKKAEAAVQKKPQSLHLFISLGQDKTVLCTVGQNCKLSATDFIQNITGGKGGGSKFISQGVYEDFNLLKLWLSNNMNVHL